MKTLSPRPTGIGTVMLMMGTARMCAAWLANNGFIVTAVTIESTCPRPLIIIEGCENCEYLDGETITDDGAGLAKRAGIKGCTVEWIEQRVCHA